jgi:hypothetical protein
MTSESPLVPLGPWYVSRRRVGVSVRVRTQQQAYDPGTPHPRPRQPWGSMRRSVESFGFWFRCGDGAEGDSRRLSE